MRPGIVVWITGLPGAGKSTIASELQNIWSGRVGPIAMLDGDTLRAIFANTDYSEKARRDLGLRYGALAHLLSSQGIDVICSTVSLWWSCHDWNRDNLDRYFEVFLDVPLDTLSKRDQKNLYSTQAQNVPGRDLNVELPKNPDMAICNDGQQTPEAIAQHILTLIQDRWTDL